MRFWEVESGTGVEGAGFLGFLVTEAAPILWDESKSNGQPWRILDVSRAEEYFGRRARVDFDEGIERTVRWWEEHR